MASLVSLLRAASASVQQSLGQATQGLYGVVEAEDTHWSESDEGFYDSTNELLNGLEVTEYTAPPALMGLLQDPSTTSTFTRG